MTLLKMPCRHFVVCLLVLCLFFFFLFHYALIRVPQLVTIFESEVYKNLFLNQTD